MDGDRLFCLLLRVRNIRQIGHAMPVTTVPFGEFASSLIDQNRSHRLGGSGEEMPSAGETRPGSRSHKLQPGFMDQCCGLQSLSGVLMSDPGSRKPPQFVIDQRQQRVRSNRITGFDLLQDASDVGHVEQRNVAYACRHGLRDWVSSHDGEQLERTHARPATVNHQAPGLDSPPLEKTKFRSQR